MHFCVLNDAHQYAQRDTVYFKQCQGKHSENLNYLRILCLSASLAKVVPPPGSINKMLNFIDNKKKKTAAVGGVKQQPITSPHQSFLKAAGKELYSRTQIYSTPNTLQGRCLVYISGGKEAVYVM